ncbi:hypothetical protein LXA43DRAFT_331441 [Ganoderma leucocontextum]|nr:hypothetical protein LXA43DRAFT_331441 [Ganoderma leucocontextum]
MACFRPLHTGFPSISSHSPVSPLSLWFHSLPHKNNSALPVAGNTRVPPCLATSQCRIARGLAGPRMASTTQGLIRPPYLFFSPTGNKDASLHQIRALLRHRTVRITPCPNHQAWPLSRAAILNPGHKITSGIANRFSTQLTLGHPVTTGAHTWRKLYRGAWFFRVLAGSLQILQNFRHRVCSACCLEFVLHSCIAYLGSRRSARRSVWNGILSFLCPYHRCTLSSDVRAPPDII